MRRVMLALVVGAISHVCLVTPLSAQDKIAQTGMQFLSVISDARAAALAGTVTGLEANSSALFFNPASMGFSQHKIDVSISQNEWIADIQHNTVSLAVRPGSGGFGVIGASLQVVDYGEIIGTRIVRGDASRDFVETGNISASAFAAGIGYAKMLSDRFSVGGQVKLVRQDLGESVIDTTGTRDDNTLSLLAFDFGTLYRTQFRGLAFGFSVRNFSEEVEFVQESFQLPLVFSIGVSIDLLELANFRTENQSIMLAIDATNARSHPEQVGFGLEYRFMDLLSLRGGYITNNDEDDITLGFGVSKFGFDFDYAYTPFGVFGNLNRVTARFAF